MSRTIHSTATIIKFCFLKAGGFRIGRSGDNDKQFGNFFPKQGMNMVQVPGVAGNAWVEGYDFNHIFEVELESETVRGLPGHIAKHSDETVKNAYKVEQAKLAAEVHTVNNEIRDELSYQEEQGLIKIVSDSFMDEQKVISEEDDTSYPAVKSVGRPKKAVE